MGTCYGKFPESAGLQHLVWLDKSYKGLASGLDMKALPLDWAYEFALHWMR